MSFTLRLLRSFEGAAGAIILMLLAVTALAAPLLFPGDPLSIVGEPLIAPFSDAASPLGTDRLGRDVLAGLAHGAQASLLVGIGAAAAALMIGTVVGTIAGFAGGLVDDALMRVTDAFQIVPNFLLALAFVSTIGPSMPIVILAIALGAWADPARLMRAQVLSIRERDYVQSARAIGMHPLEIAFRQILPNALPPVLALAAIIVAAAILTEAALSFLGLWRSEYRYLGFDDRGRTQRAALGGVSLSHPRHRSSGHGSRRLSSRGGDQQSDGDRERNAMSGNALCRIDDLSVRYAAGDGPALQDISLTIRQGQRLAIIGESGSGKSTLAKAIAGLLPVSARVSGDISWSRDSGLFTDRPQPGRDIGYIFQDTGATLNPVLTIGEQVAEGAVRHLGLSWKQARDLARDLLERVRLPHPTHLLGAYPHQLSGGQRQRVAIAAAIAAHPAILIADEATSALDTVSQAAIAALLDGLVREEERTLVFITHDIGLASCLADEIAVLHAGRLVEHGTTRRVLSAPAHDYTRALLSDYLDLSTPPLIDEAAS